MIKRLLVFILFFFLPSFKAVSLYAPFITLKESYFSRECKNKKVIQFIQEQAVLAGRDPQKTKIFITNRKDDLHASFMSFSDVIYLDSEKQDRIKECIDSEEEKDKNYLYLMQGSLLHEYGHTALHKFISPLRKILILWGPQIACYFLGVYAKNQLQDRFGFVDEDIKKAMIAMVNMVVMGADILLLSHSVDTFFAQSKKEEAEADDFSIQKIEKNILQKNDREKAVLILQATANYYKEHHEKNKQAGRSGDWWHPSPYSRYQKFATTANTWVDLYKLDALKFKKDILPE